MPAARSSIARARAAEVADTRLVVLACGNTARGDDALGPLVLARIEALGLAGVTTIEDYQLNIEHALDIEDADLVLFIDAGAGTPAPFSFAEAVADSALSHSTHAIEPPAVLATFTRVFGRPPPPSFVLCPRGEAFDLGAPMSMAAEADLAAAWDFLRPLLEDIDVGRWRQALDQFATVA